MNEQLISITSNRNRDGAAHGPAVLPLAVRLRTRERGGAGLQGRRHHHPHQSDRRELVRGDDKRRVRLLSHQLRRGPSAPTPMRLVTLTLYKRLTLWKLHLLMLYFSASKSSDSRQLELY